MLYDDKKLWLELSKVTFNTELKIEKIGLE